MSHVLYLLMVCVGIGRPANSAMLAAREEWMGVVLEAKGAAKG